jgi:hypothetical protein
MAKNEL